MRGTRVFVARGVVAVLVLVASLAAASICAAQGRRVNRPATAGAGRQTANPPRPPGAQGDLPPAPGPNDPVSPAYIQTLFDAMAVSQAERFVQLGPEQFPHFVRGLKRLQDVRNQHMRRRMRVINELRGLAGMQGKGDDAAIEAKIKQLDALEAEDAAAIRRAKDEIDQVLTPRQRGRFRLLEENIERDKLDFLTRVRQNGRGPIKPPK